MSSSNLNEEATEFLLQEIADGNRDAEQALVAKHWRGLYFVLTRRSQDPELAADLAQESFLIVIAKARSAGIENPAGFISYIRQIGINLLIAHRRKERRQATEKYAELDSFIPDNSPDIYRQLHATSTLALVQKLFDELPTDRDKQILREYFVYERDKTTICQNLSLSTVHFDRVLFRAKQRLRKLVESELGTATSSELAADTLKTVTFTTVIFMQCLLPHFLPEKDARLVRELPETWHLRM